MAVVLEIEMRCSNLQSACEVMEDGSETSDRLVRSRTE
jgi:hypothetical protein